MPHRNGMARLKVRARLTGKARQVKARLTNKQGPQARQGKSMQDNAHRH
jgi:hypothetical protein